MHSYRPNPPGLPCIYLLSNIGYAWWDPPSRAAAYQSASPFTLATHLPATHLANMKEQLSAIRLPFLKRRTFAHNRWQNCRSQPNSKAKRTPTHSKHLRANVLRTTPHVENAFLPHSDGKVLFVMLKAERAKTEKKDLETTPFGVES